MAEHPGKFCRTDEDGIVNHSWDCDEADPMSDVLGVLVGATPTNPLLKESHQKLVQKWNPYA